MMVIKTKQSTEDLIEENQGLVYHLAARIHRNLPVRHELDDLIGNGMVGLAEAAKNFQPGRGAQFTTFAFRRIQGAIYDGLAKNSWMSRARYRRHLREQQPTTEQIKEDASSNWQPPEATVQELTTEHIEQLSDDEPSEEAVVDRRETEDILCRLVDDLPDRERQLINLVYFDSLSLQEAADRIGVSKSWASRLHAKIIVKLGLELKTSQEGPHTKPEEPTDSNKNPTD